MAANIVAGGVVVSRQHHEGATTASEDQRHTQLQATFGGNSPSENMGMQHEVHSDHMYIQQHTPATVPVEHDISKLDDEQRRKATGDDASRDQNMTQHDQLDSKLTPNELSPIDAKTQNDVSVLARASVPDIEAPPGNRFEPKAESTL